MKAILIRSLILPGECNAVVGRGDNLHIDGRRGRRLAGWRGLIRPEPHAGLTAVVTTAATRSVGARIAAAAIPAHRIRLLAVVTDLEMDMLDTSSASTARDHLTGYHRSPDLD